MVVEFSKKKYNIGGRFFAIFFFGFHIAKSMYECTRKNNLEQGLNFYSELLSLLVDLKFGFSF